MDVKENDLVEENISHIVEIVGDSELAEEGVTVADNPGSECEDANIGWEACSAEEELAAEGQANRPTGDEANEGVGANDVADATLDWTKGVDEYSHPFWVLLEHAWYERW